MEKNNYYVVTVKCGHVGRKNYIPIDMPVRASSSREAASMARNRGRVKHHWKDAIVDVKAVDAILFREIINVNRQDPYLNSHSSTDQKINCLDLGDRIVCPEESTEFDPFERARRIAFLLKKQASAAWRFLRA